MFLLGSYDPKFIPADCQLHIQKRLLGLTDRSFRQKFSSEDRHHTRVLLDRLTEARPCLDAAALHREGLMVEGASRLQTGHGGYLAATHDGGIYIDGFRIQLASAPVLPWTVFLCPACSCVRYKLYEVGGRWACYRCHGLSHASRHRYRTIPHYHRLMRLRRKIGADPRPFTPIAPKRRNAYRYWRIVREIRQLEAGLVQHARQDVSAVLERRLKR